ncbi:NRT2 ribosyltransferase, partial [Penelope pileata]|nr:NRT2 ribosyltransferase [Penelope pileata]
MEPLALGWVLLAGTLASTMATNSTQHEGDLGPIKKIAMDMAPRSFDDQYLGCSHLMEARIRKLINYELAKNNAYAYSWSRAAAEWQKRWGNAAHAQALRREQAMALLAYTLPAGLYQQFNAATREGGRSRQHYLHSYHFKGLHFHLTQALRTLKQYQPNYCYQVYRGVKGIRFTAWQHQKVRFGQFTSTSLHKNSALFFGQDTFFSVKTCYGVPIKHFSFYPNENEVLIPPFETFKVISITYNNGRPVISLLSTGKKSNYNCVLVKGRG